MRNITPAQAQARPPLDEDERSWRNEVVEEAFRLYAGLGLRLDRRCADLIEAYRVGAIEIEELRLEIMRPFVH